MYGRCIALYTRRLAVECSRTFSTFGRPVKNASRYRVGQSTGAWVVGRASANVAHRSVTPHRAARVASTAAYRSPFPPHVFIAHRAFWPTFCYAGRTFPNLRSRLPVGYKYRSPLEPRVIFECIVLLCSRAVDFAVTILSSHRRISSILRKILLFCYYCFF